MSRARRLAAVSFSTALIIAAITLIPASSASAARIPFGTGQWDQNQVRDRDFKRLFANKIRVFRATIDWSLIEPVPGARNFGPTDDLVRRAARRKIRILPILISSPFFIRRATRFPPEGDASLAAFSRYVTAVVDRYGRGGSFWRENPGLPNRAFKAYQVWNEPHLAFFWGKRPNTAEYLNLAKIARRAARSEDGRAKIFTASITQNGRGYIRRLMRRRGAKGTFDAFALNLYHRRLRSARGAQRATLNVRRTLNRAGFRKPLWVTEFGWRSSSTRRRRSSRRGLRTQSRRVRQTVKLLLAKRRRLRLGSLIYFSYRDGAYTGGFPASYRTGLRTLTNRPKPAYFTFTRLARRYGSRRP